MYDVLSQALVAEREIATAAALRHARHLTLPVGPVARARRRIVAAFTGRPAWRPAHPDVQLAID